MPELQNVQRFLATPKSCMWWTNEPNKMLNIFRALNKHTDTIPTTNNNYKKFVNMRLNLRRLSFRMLLLSVSVIGKLCSIPIIKSLLKAPNYLCLFLSHHMETALSAYYKCRNWSISVLQKKDPSLIKTTILTVLEELETKPSNKCLLCSNPLNNMNKFEHNTCTKCQNKWTHAPQIDPIIINLIGRPINEELIAYKYHNKYLFEPKSHQILTHHDLKYLQRKITHDKSGNKLDDPIPAVCIDGILANECKLGASTSNTQTDPEIYFHVVLLSVFHHFVVQALTKFGKGLMGPRLMLLLTIDSKYGSDVGTTIVNHVEKDRKQWLKVVVDHIGDKNPKYGGGTANVKVSNIQELIDESIYDGPLKYLASCDRGQSYYNGLKFFAECGGSLLAKDRHTDALRGLLLRLSDEIRTSFVCFDCTLVVSAFVHKILANGTSQTHSAAQCFEVSITTIIRTQRAK
eukprot:131753_1